MKSNAEKAALSPLVQVLYIEFDDLFLDTEPSFIRKIQRKLSNLCRAADSNKGSRKDLGPTTPSAPNEEVAKLAPSAPTSNPIPMAVNTKDFSIRARMSQKPTIGHSSRAYLLSVATIREVLPKHQLNNDNPTIHVSFKLWADFLRQDVDYAECHTIRYR